MLPNYRRNVNFFIGIMGGIFQKVFFLVKIGKKISENTNCCDFASGGQGVSKR
jgi:hypothetical protein